ncbi:response regulator [Paenibacillus sp. UNC451MF]|uniref:response regulator n=1 Tax=Paenibacillus sp. UNC451MF TaxID=1449063 RepID=UPI00048AFB5D|nr:response regulator [Paenibacillus sp. UNC451MF]
MSVKKTMLVIDDQYGIRLFLSKVFAEEGFEVHLARHGRQGIELFNETAPDIVLLDIKIPGMDGIEILKELMMLNSHAKVIMMTSYEDHYDECMELGAADYLQKPFDLEDLKERIYASLSVAELQ